MHSTKPVPNCRSPIGPRDILSILFTRSVFVRIESIAWTLLMEMVLQKAKRCVPLGGDKFPLGGHADEPLQRNWLGLNN